MEEPPAVRPPAVDVLPAPEPSDPVALAEGRLEMAEADLEASRTVLVHAKLTLLACKGLAVEGVLHGSLHQGDELHQQAVQEVDSAKQEYDRCFQERADATLALTAATREHHRGHQQAWVEAHRPELVRHRDYWAEELRTATSDRMHAEAKRQFAAAQLAYQTALLTAPVPMNGTTAQKE